MIQKREYKIKVKDFTTIFFLEGEARKEMEEILEMIKFVEEKRKEMPFEILSNSILAIKAKLFCFVTHFLFNFGIKNTVPKIDIGDNFSFITAYYFSLDRKNPEFPLLVAKVEGLIVSSDLIESQVFFESGKELKVIEDLLVLSFSLSPFSEIKTGYIKREEKGFCLSISPANYLGEVLETASYFYEKIKDSYLDLVQLSKSLKEIPSFYRKSLSEKYISALLEALGIKIYI